MKNFRQWFNTLKKYGFIDDKKDIFTFDCSKMGDIDEYLKQLKHMGISKAMEQIVRCVVSIRKLLPDILLGKADPVSEVFFKDGDIQSGVGIYRNSVTGQIYGRLAAELTMSLIAANEGKPFRILEVGAGVGGTSDCRSWRSNFIFNKSNRDEFPKVLRLRLFQLNNWVQMVVVILV